MALSAFAKNLANDIYRAGGAFLSEDAGVTYRDMGQVKGGEISFDPIVTDLDTAGREKQLGFTMEVLFIMQQTSDTELGSLDAVVNPTPANGLWLKMSTVHTNAAGAAAAAGYLFKNVLPVASGRINLSGNESNITVTIKGRVSVANFVTIGSTQIVTFDA